MNPANFGPQHHKDSLFTARMRFHQSWYRSQVLKIPCGTGPRPSNKTLIGNMLTVKDGNSGKNFLTPSIFQSVKERMEIRKGAVEPFRLLCNMLSEQALCFNLFAPLQQNHSLSVSLLRSVLPDSVRGVQKVMFAYFPQPTNALFNNNLPFELFIEYKRPNGNLAFAAVTILLNDSTPHKLFTNASYHHYIQSADSPWQDNIWQYATTQQTANQIWRKHMLAYAFQQIHNERYTDGFFMVIYPHQDEDCLKTIEEYQSYLKSPERFLTFTCQEIIQLWQQQADDPQFCHWMEMLNLRYVQFELSEADFKAFRSLNNPTEEVP